MIDPYKLKARAYQCACEHGFHETEHYDSFYLALIMSEIGEAINADRHNKHADLAKFKTIMRQPLSTNPTFCDVPLTKKFKFWDSFNELIKDTVEDELADIAIRILDLAGSADYDVYSYFRNLGNIDFTSIKELPFIDFCYEMFSILADDEIFTDDKMNEAMDLLCLYCRSNGIDIITHIYLKMKYNEMRPKLNGKKY